MTAPHAVRLITLLGTSPTVWPHTVALVALLGNYPAAWSRCSYRRTGITLCSRELDGDKQNLPEIA